MADLTARLLWYRLGESTEHLGTLWTGINYIANAGGTILNYIFLGWLLFGIVTIVIVSLLQRHDMSRRPPDFQQTEYVCRECQSAAEKHKISPSVSQHVMNGSALSQRSEWHNDLLEWLSSRESQWKAPLMETLLSAMTDESRNIGGDLFVTFESFLPVGDAPLLNIEKMDPYNSGSDKLVMHGDIQLSGLQLSLTVSDNSASIHSNLLLVIHLLKMQLAIDVESSPEAISLLVKPREIANSDIQFSPYHQGVDCITDERKLIHHVTSIFTQLSVPIHLAVNTRGGTTPMVKELASAQSTGSLRPPKPPRVMEDKRLMIKLIKATKLNKRNIGLLMDENLIVKVLNARGLHAWRLFATMDAYCIVEVDNPYQTHSTSIVRNTVNPYWDEHFLFDLGAYTKMVTFRVYGNSKHTDDNRNCLGECQLEMDKLRANHGVRMVLPLESRPDMSDPVSGSVTIEAFFVDAAEFESVSSPEVDDVFAQSVEPFTSDVDSPLSEPASLNGDSRMSSLSLSGSTSKVIKTTTFTQKDRISVDSQNSGSVGRVEKTEKVQSLSNEDGVVTEQVQVLPGVDLGNAEVITVYPNQSVTEVVMRELKERSKRPKISTGTTTSTIIITAASRSDDSSGGTPSVNLDFSQPHQQQHEQLPHTPTPPPSMTSTPAQLPPPSPQPIELRAEPPPPTERKSRLSGLKKRFTRTKDKKPRSHSIERSSGIDEHRYLDPGHHTAMETSKSDAALGLRSSKKKFGSLRKLLRIGSRSSSASRLKNLSDNERLHDDHRDYERRASIDGNRPDHHGSRSSMERGTTPPHHRTLSPSSSYGYRSPSYDSDTPIRSETVNLGASIAIDAGQRSYDDERHYTMPSRRRRAP